MKSLAFLAATAIIATAAHAASYLPYSGTFTDEANTRIQFIDNPAYGADGVVKIGELKGNIRHIWKDAAGKETFVGRYSQILFEKTDKSTLRCNYTFNQIYREVKMSLLSGSDVDCPLGRTLKAVVDPNHEHADAIKSPEAQR